MSLYDTTLNVNGHNYDIAVSYTYSPGTKGVYRDGQQVEPVELPTVEIYRCVIHTNKGRELFPLLKPLEDELEQEIMESLR